MKNTSNDSLSARLKELPGGSFLNIRSVPPFAVGATLAVLWTWLMSGLPAKWLMALAAAPLYLTYRTYKVYLGRIEDEQRHVQEMADLHLATIEALALAIDAKDQTSQSHIRRVQLYAAAVARALGMSENEIQGVKTAALLHDIGKLAVPEHILSKPGPLTPEEFQKIRAHPQVGADIISCGAVPVSGGAADPQPPRALGRQGLSRRAEGRRDSARRAHPLGRRLLRRADGRAAVPQGDELRRARSACCSRKRARALDPAVVDDVHRAAAGAPGGGDAARAARCGGRDRGTPAGRSAARRPASRPSRRTKNVFEDIALAHREIYALYEIAQAMGTQPRRRRHDGADLVEAEQPRAVLVRGAVPLRRGDRDAALPVRDRHRRRHHPADRGPQRRGADRLGGAQPPAARQRAAERRPRGGRPPVARTTLQSALVCPLLFNERFIGTLSVYHIEPAFYRDDHRRLLDRVSEQAAAVINNSMVFEQTQEDSLTDPLTGLPNTRFMFMHLTRELARAERLKAEVSLMVMDLDSFKEINDTHGHHVGDRALREVARVLRAAIRPYDICVRYAGDEFIVVLSGCGAEEAERKRAGAAEERSTTCYFEARPGKRLQLGISVGAAVFPHDGESYETLLATADSRMYQDKAGRKRRTPRDTTDMLNAERLSRPPSESPASGARRASTRIIRVDLAGCTLQLQARSGRDHRHCRPAATQIPYSIASSPGRSRETRLRSSS